MKTVKFWGLAALGALAFGLAAPVSAQAATWHRGTPKALRGKYQAVRKTAAQGFADEYRFTAKTFTWAVSNMPLQRHTHLKYRSLGHHLYRLKGHVAKRGIVLAGQRDYVIYKKGKTLKVTDYGSYRNMGFKHIVVAHQVTHFKAA